MDYVFTDRGSSSIPFTREEIIGFLNIQVSSHSEVHGRAGSNQKYQLFRLFLELENMSFLMTDLDNDINENFYDVQQARHVIAQIIKHGHRYGHHDIFTWFPVKNFKVKL